jgi:asparagine synthase (glutamine-hydrolysing)
VALECRAPMLDHRVVAFAWRLPLALKVGPGGSKWVLRQVLRRHLPAALAERPKAGFGPPVGPWLRGPLRDWAEDLLGEERLRRDGFLDPAAVRGKWRAHLEGKGAWQEHLWDALMFQAWVDVHRPSG